MNSALLLIDIQNDYFLGGRCELYQTKQTSSQAKKMLFKFRKCKLPIFHIQHINESKNATFFISNTIGANIHESVFPQTGEKLIKKHTPDSFFQTNLNDELNIMNINHLVVCGMMTHMCVDTTVRVAKNLGYSVTLIEDACTTKALEWNNNIIPAHIVQSVYMASLNKKFAEITTADKWKT